MSGEIRRAGAQDVAGVHELLSQVLEVHAAGRPDLFRTGTRKYTDDELLGIFSNDETPVFVAVEGSEVLGHAFCVLEDHTAENNWRTSRPSTSTTSASARRAVAGTWVRTSTSTSSTTHAALAATT